MKQILSILVVITAAFIGAVAGVILTLRYVENTPVYNSIEQRQNLTLARMKPDSSHRISITPDFEYSAKLITPAVVHISTIYGAGQFSINPLELYRPQTHSSGSGVIISDDGYIVTNNHVIEEATSVEVEMNDNQRFYAKVVGRDPSTDLALLKIKGKNLPFIRYGNSDEIVPGQWVLAVGNPFDLNSTVTAGIVSAKARNIGILRDRNHLEVESFIQTDAAVNPGNSGGALVNLKGELVGINSAIATATGSYSGYSFAIPSNLVKKIMDDLLEFGIPQRGFLGVQILSVTAQMAELENLDVLKGVYVSRVNDGSAAQASGMESGDVITAVDGSAVGSVSELQEVIARHRPGQTVNVTYRRKGNEKISKTVLKNFEGSESAVREEVSFSLFGATLEDVSYSELTKRNLDGGVLFKSIAEGKWKKAGIRNDFILTHLDKVNVDNVEDLNRMLSYKSGGILLEGVYRSGEKAVYAIDW